jgi:hypothetical protein
MYLWLIPINTFGGMIMYAEMALREEGMKILINKLGQVEAERFISLIIREPFDYTEWQRDLFNDMSVKELSNIAMNEYK